MVYKLWFIELYLLSISVLNICRWVEKWSRLFIMVTAGIYISDEIVQILFYMIYWLVTVLIYFICWWEQMTWKSNRITRWSSIWHNNLRLVIFVLHSVYPGIFLACCHKSTRTQNIKWSKCLSVLVILSKYWGNNAFSNFFLMDF